MTDQKMRCFLAISLTQYACEQVQRCIDMSPRQRWPNNISRVAPRNWHVTLAFLGDQSASRIERLCNHLQQHISQEVGPGIMLRSRWICGFPDAKSQVVALELHPDGALISVKTSVDQVLKAQGFTLDSRPFRPHITLGRLQADQVVNADPWRCDVNIAASQLALYQSTLSPQGSEYRMLWALPLAMFS